MGAELLVPGAAVWLSALCLMLMTATNLVLGVVLRRIRPWFAGIKVATIVIFLGLGTAVFGLLPGRQADFSNLTSHGGFFSEWRRYSPRLWW